MHIIHYLNAAWVDKAPWIQNCPQHFLFAIELMFGLPLGLDQFQKLPFSTDLNLLGEWLSTSNISFAQASLILAHQLCETNKQLSVHTVVGETHSIPAALSAFILKPQETYNCSWNLQLFMKLITVHETYNCSWNLLGQMTERRSGHWFCWVREEEVPHHVFLPSFCRPVGVEKNNKKIQHFFTSIQGTKRKK